MYEYYDHDGTSVNESNGSDICECHDFLKYFLELFSFDFFGLNFWEKF